MDCNAKGVNKLDNSSIGDMLETMYQRWMDVFPSPTIENLDAFMETIKATGLFSEEDLREYHNSYKIMTGLTRYGRGLEKGRHYEPLLNENNEKIGERMIDAFVGESWEEAVAREEAEGINTKEIIYYTEEEIRKETEEYAARWLARFGKPYPLTE